MPFAIVFSATLTLLALLSPVALLVALVRAAIDRTRASGLRLLAWEAAGAVAGAIALVILNLLRYRRFEAIYLDAVAIAFAAGITIGAAAYLVRWVRHRRAARTADAGAASPSSSNKARTAGTR